jgi:hypothetical protein
VTARERALNYATAVAALATIAWWVSPGRNTAKVLEAQGAAFSSMIKVATAVAARDETIIPIIQEMSDADRARATAGLSDADLFWIEAMLNGTEA